MKLEIPGGGKLAPRTGKTALGVSVLVLAGLVVFAGLACAQQSQSQTSGQPNGPDTSTQNQSPTRSRTHHAPLAKADGKWHSFGETRKPERRQQPAIHGWHYFGEAYSATYPSPSRAPRPFRKAPTTTAAPVTKWHVMPPPAAAPSAAASTTTARATAPSPHYRAAETRTEPAPRRETTRSAYGATKIAYLEREMFGLINRDRRNHGAPPLRWNAQLADVARSHSLDMIREHYFGHDDPQGRTVAGRVTDAGFAWQAVGENIAIAPSVTYAESEFMDEPHDQHNHRWNILNPGYTEVGVGIVRASDGNYYFTQDFMHPR